MKLPRKLDAEEEDLYNLLRRGHGYDASPREWRGCAESLAAMRRLVNLGVARLTKPMPWAKSGVYVLNEENGGERDESASQAN